MRVRPRRPLPPRQAVAVSAVLLAFLTLLSIVSWQRDAALRDADRLQPVQAEVISYRDRLLKADRLRVRYDVPGRDPVTTSLRVESEARYEPGQTVSVLYDATSPRRARTADDWSPSSPVMQIVLIGGGLVLFGLSVARLVRSSAAAA